MQRIGCGQLRLLDTAEPLRFDAVEGHRLKLAGQERALETAGTEWKGRALEVIRYVAMHHAEFTSEA